MRFTIALFAVILIYSPCLLLGYLIPSSPPSTQLIETSSSIESSTVESVKSLTDFDSLGEIASTKGYDRLLKTSSLNHKSFDFLDNLLISYDKVPNVFELDPLKPPIELKEIQGTENKNQMIKDTLTKFRPKGLKQIGIATGISASYFVGQELSKSNKKRIQREQKAALEKKKKEQALALKKAKEERLMLQAKEAKKIASNVFGVLLGSILVTQAVRATKLNEFLKGSTSARSPTANVAVTNKPSPPPPPSEPLSKPSNPVPAPKPFSPAIIREEREVNKINKFEQVEEKAPVPSSSVITRTEDQLLSVKDSVIPLLAKISPQTLQIVALATGISATYFLTEQYQSQKDQLSSTEEKLRIGQKTLEETIMANKRAEEEELQLIAAQRASAKVLERKLQAAREEEQRISSNSRPSSRSDQEREMERQRSVKVMEAQGTSPQQSTQQQATSIRNRDNKPRSPLKTNSLATRLQQERQMERDRKEKAKQIAAMARRNLSEEPRQPFVPAPQRTPATPMTSTSQNHTIPKKSISTRLQEERQSERERKAKANQITSTLSSSMGQGGQEFVAPVTPGTPVTPSPRTPTLGTESLSSRYQQERQMDAQRKAKANQVNTMTNTGLGSPMQTSTPVFPRTTPPPPSSTTPATSARKTGPSRSQQERQMERERKRRANVQF